MRAVLTVEIEIDEIDDHHASSIEQCEVQMRQAADMIETLPGFDVIEARPRGVQW